MPKCPSSTLRDSRFSRPAQQEHDRRTIGQTLGIHELYLKPFLCSPVSLGLLRATNMEVPYLGNPSIGPGEPVHAEFSLRIIF